MAGRPTIEEEFREFVAARSAALLRTAYLLAGDWATAEDLLQTALTKTYLAWKRLGEIEAVEPYARRVLVNTATSWWRRRWHGERPTEVLPERAAPDGNDAILERDALWHHVRALPARQRAVLVLRFYEDLSEAQTAALLSVSVGTVKSQCARALGALRTRLGDLAPAGGNPPTPARRAAARAAAARTVARGTRNPPVVGSAVVGGPARAEVPASNPQTLAVPVPRGSVETSAPLPEAVVPARSAGAAARGRGVVLFDAPEPELADGG